MRWGQIAVAVLGVGVLLAAAARPVSHALVAPAGPEQAARPGPCSKPKVYVKVAFVEGVERYLNEDRGPRSNQEWLDHISRTAVDWLRASGGEGVDVIPHETKVFVDDMPETPEPENSFSDTVPGEYVFRLYLGLADRRDLITYVRDRTKTDYVAQAALASADPFGTYVGAFSVENSNLEKAIGGAITRLIERGLTDRIARYEANHGNALRDPTLTVSLLGEHDWVSPEPEERDARFLALATDCRGRRFDRTYIYYGHSPSRGKVDALNEAESIHRAADSALSVAITDITGSVQLKYLLEQGTASGTETVRVLVIGRGRKTVEQDVTIKIKGLLLEVQPARPRLTPGEQTNVRLQLFKTSDKGSREPMAERQIDVKAHGLVDGSVAPVGAVTTDADGVATVMYTAGRSDKAVKIVGTYQPQGYRDSVTGDATVTVEEPSGDLDLFLATDASQQGECTSTFSGPPSSTTTASFTRQLHAQLRAACALEDRRADRAGAFGGKVIIEQYLCRHPLLSFTSSGSARSVTVGRRSSTREWIERLQNASLTEDTTRVSVELDPVSRTMMFVHWAGTDLLTRTEISEDITSSGRTRHSTRTEAEPFRFYPIGTFESRYAAAPGTLRATGFDIPMLVFPGFGLPYEFGDGKIYVGGSFTASRQARNQNSYFRIPPVCRKDTSERFEIRWEIRRRPSR